MRMMTFSLPYIDQPLEFWQRLREHRQLIEEIYFPIRAEVVPTGRPRQSQNYLYTFLTMADLPKAVLINPIVLPKSLAQIQDDILRELAILHDSYSVERVTVTDLLLARAIKQHLPQLRLSASVLLRIQSPQQLPYLQDLFDSITVDTAINRNLPMIRSIRHIFQGRIKLIVNEGCLPLCPLRTQHFYEMASDRAHPESLCEDLLQEQPWLRLTSGWIPPQFLSLYEDAVDVIKLAGRVTLQNPQKYLDVFTAYRMGATLPVNELGCGPAGLLQDVPITKEFFQFTLTCDKNCVACVVCRDYYERHAPQ
jgi:hypothetical protein